jgi:hypothetical protein
LFPLSLPHRRKITLRAGGMGADRIGNIGDRTSERQATGAYGTGFTSG